MGWHGEENTTTGAWNMREHREAKRLAAERRNALVAPERRAVMHKLADADVVPAKKKRKRSKQQKRKQAAALAALEALTREWVEETGPGVDF